MYFTTFRNAFYKVTSFASDQISKLYSNCSAHNLKNLLLTMPKESKHRDDLNRHRQKLKEKGKKYVPGTVTLQVLGSGAKGAPRSLYIFSDQSKYLFNCGEGSQRLAHEHKMKLSKLEHIFITHPTWENIGGLPGVALTIQDVGVPQITLHGPVGTDEIFRATRRFVILKDLSIVMADCIEKSHFEDNVMTVYYSPIHGLKKSISKMVNNIVSGPQSIATNMTLDSEAGEMLENDDESHSSPRKQVESEDEVDYYEHERKNKRRQHSTERDVKRFKKDSEGEADHVSVSDAATAMCYVCQLKPRAGALCLERCVEHGVPPGPLLGILKSGEDVMLHDGTLIRSADVRLPDDPGPVFVVVECPGEDYLDSLLGNKMFEKHQSTATRDEDLAYLVVHFTPPSVVQDPRYRRWMERFSVSTRHLMINDVNTCMGSVAVHRIQHQLNLLHPEIFPLLDDHGIPVEDEESPDGSLRNGGVQEALTPEGAENNMQSEKEATTDDLSSSFAVTQGKTFFNVHLRPRKELDSQGELRLSPKQFRAEAFAVEGFEDELLKLRLRLSEPRPDPRPYPRLVFLGTGSCIPNKTRNTSGIVLHTSESDCILLDCGEGTYGQLVRFYGRDKVDQVLRNLRAIYVSHLHADHHIGFVGVLKGRRRAFGGNIPQQEPVFLLAPKQIMSWLNLYHCHFEPILQDLELISNGGLDMDSNKPISKSLEQMLNRLNLSNVRTVLVRHCPNAFGVAFTHRSGWKITYSGDTMPCPELVNLGQGSDLLIHEATMEDELEGEARLKLHSTTSQAIGVGRSMEAGFILLTHFSQRYAKLPRFNNNFTSNVGIAFDNMQVRLDDLPLLPLMYPSLKLMFADHCEEMELKAARRQRKREREAKSPHPNFTI